MATEFIMVPVPRERVQEVYRLLASAPGTPAAEEAEAAPDDTARRWSDAEIARAYRESPQKMKVFLEYLAGRPGQPATVEETAAAVGYTRHQQAGMLGAFGHRAKKRYGKEAWFIDYGWSGQRGAWAYTMFDDAAQVIRGLSG